MPIKSNRVHPNKKKSHIQHPNCIWLGRRFDVSLLDIGTIASFELGLNLTLGSLLQNARKMSFGMFSHVLIKMSTKCKKNVGWNLRFCGNGQNDYPNERRT